MTQAIINKDEIKKIIPHREPMLFIDEVVELKPEESIVAKFYLEADCEFLKGHFPENPVMPGVLIVEAMAQTTDVLLLSMERYKGMIPYFVGIDGLRFKKKVLPGDTIRIEAKISKEDTRLSIVKCEATVFNEDEISARGIVSLAMRK